MNLERFVDAQELDYYTALKEVKDGRKKTHWIWYIFPQIKGIGDSTTSKYYSIESINEAIAYYKHPILGSRLKEITTALLNSKENNVFEIFGNPDYLKVKSCMTLFYFTSNDILFKKVLDKYYHGEFDTKTIDICKRLLGYDNR